MRHQFMFFVSIVLTFFHTYANEDYSNTVLFDTNPDYVNLQFPKNITISEGNSATVYGQIYEAGLTDVEPGLSGQASGILAWVGISPVGQNTNPNTWTTWIPATWNSFHISNNDEYQVKIGQGLPVGTYYYATRFSLNGGPFSYGGINGAGNGGFWNGNNYKSGVLTITPSILGDNCVAPIALDLYEPYLATNVGGTVSNETPIPSCASVNFSTNAKDIWFAVQVPINANALIVETYDNATPDDLADTVLQAYRGTCGALTPLLCDDDGGIDKFSYLNLTGLIPGEMILLRANGYNGVAGDFFIEVKLASCTAYTIWNGSAWSNGIPNLSKMAVMSGNYSGVGFSACGLMVKENAIVTLPQNETLIIDGAVSVEPTASLSLANNANLVQIQNTTNLGSITVNRNSAPIVRLDYTSWSSPVLGQNLFSFSPLTVANRFYTYNPNGTTTPTAWLPIAPTTNDFVPGEAVLIRAPNTWSSTTASSYNGIFTGVPNNGVVTKNLLVGYNMLGNPYASPIDANAFIFDNSGLGVSTLYFWTHTIAANNGSYALNNYASYTTAGGVASQAGGEAPDGNIQVGQGFLTNVTTAGTAQFNNAQRRTVSSGQFFKSAQTSTIEKHRFWLDLTSPNQLHNQILIAYMTGASENEDLGIDGLLFGDTNSAIYTLVNNKNYVIQGRGLPFSDTDVVDLGFKAFENGSFTISLSNFDGLFSSTQDVFLKDNNTGILHDIKNSPYVFTSIAGEFYNRFQIVYKQAALTVSSYELSEENTNIYASNGLLIIKTEVSKINQVTVYDIAGRTLYKLSNTNKSEVVINNLQATNQVVLVEVIGEQGNNVTKKVIF